MTQWEYVEELDLYLRKTYDVALILERNRNWRFGFKLTITRNGNENFNRMATSFNGDAENWKDKLFDEVNRYLKKYKYIE